MNGMFSQLKSWLFPRKQDSDSLPWWIEIKTRHPACIYYFGPYNNPQEAAAQKPGFLEDLQSENAVGINVHIKRAQPEQLTIVQNDSSQ